MLSEAAEPAFYGKEWPTGDQIPLAARLRVFTIDHSLFIMFKENIRNCLRILRPYQDVLLINLLLSLKTGPSYALIRVSFFLLLPVNSQNALDTCTTDRTVVELASALRTHHSMAARDKRGVDIAIVVHADAAQIGPRLYFRPHRVSCPRGVPVLRSPPHCTEFARNSGATTSPPLASTALRGHYLNTVIPPAHPLRTKRCRAQGSASPTQRLRLTR
jgi:hypothetical protein